MPELFAMKSTRLLISLCLLFCAPFAMADRAMADEPAVTIAPDVQQLVSELAADPGVKMALKNIEDQDAQLIADLIELTEIPAPPFGEEHRAARFAEMLTAAGLPGGSRRLCAGRTSAIEGGGRRSRRYYQCHRAFEQRH